MRVRGQWRSPRGGAWTEHCALCRNLLGMDTRSWSLARLEADVTGNHGYGNNCCETPVGMWRNDALYSTADIAVSTHHHHHHHNHNHHHHHQLARTKSIAVSTMRRQEGRSVARRNAEWSPRLSSLRSLSIVRSQDWRGRPLGWCQSTGRRSVDARSAREWSSEAAARAICPNILRRHCCISEETGGWLVCDRTDTLVTCAV